MNNKATPHKTPQLKLNKEDWDVNLLHELELLENDINRNYSKLSAKVDSNITELKSVQSSVSNLSGLPAKVDKLEDTTANLLSKNTQLEAEICY